MAIVADLIVKARQPREVGLRREHDLRAVVADAAMAPVADSDEADRVPVHIAIVRQQRGGI